MIVTREIAVDCFFMARGIAVGFIKASGIVVCLNMGIGIEADSFNVGGGIETDCFNVARRTSDDYVTI